MNPKVEEILENKRYSSLENLPAKPDVVDIVVPPEVAKETVKICKRLGITKVWMQPGSESETAIKFCLENGIEVLYGLCVMVERAKHRAR